MTEQRYKLPIPTRWVGKAAVVELNPTLKECAIIEAQCKAIREQAEAEAEKPKAWDFGIGWYSGKLRISLSDTDDHLWSSPQEVTCLGNLKDIVENQGPIVIGMTEEEAAAITQGGHPPGIYGRAVETLARFRKGKK